ncbi:choline/ethanolamine transporter flvcr2a-like [Clavelina lepadiformis]|uniref:choline/ethanolamine transporter flvcr2a-like n=1 Tax=Clavelina lepadiformis TaxID=159417 RepID=UPI004041F4B6
MVEIAESTLCLIPQASAKWYDHDTSCYVDDVSDSSWTDTDDESNELDLSLGSYLPFAKRNKPGNAHLQLLRCDLTSISASQMFKDRNGSLDKKEKMTKLWLDNMPVEKHTNRPGLTESEIYDANDCNKSLYDDTRSIKEEDVGKGNKSDEEMDNWCVINSTGTRATPQRWFVITIVFASILVRSFVSVVFGQVNDIFSTFYDVPPDAADWLTNSGPVGTLLVIPAVAYMGKKKTDLRKLCLLMTGSASVGTCLLTAAMMNRETGFVIAIIGQTTMGANNAIAMSIAPLVAGTWFPESEVATALGISFIAVGVGDSLGTYLPPLVVTSSGTFSGFTPEESVQLKLVIIFLSTALVSIATFLIAVACLEERPNFPPSKAEQKRRKDETSAEEQIVFSPLISKTFVLVAFLYGISSASAANSVALLSSMMRDTFGVSGFVQNIDVISGQVMTTMFVCFSVGPLAAGRVLDKTKRHRTTALVGMFGLALGTTGVTLSFATRRVILVYVSHALLGFFMGVSETTLFEIASEVTYPLPQIQFSSVLVGSWMTFFIFYPVVGRIALSVKLNILTSSAVASLLPTAFSITSFLIALLFLKPELRRKNATSDDVTPSERTPLNVV